MKVLIDTNVIVDVLLKREPFAAQSSKIIFLSEKAMIEGYVSASTATDIFYIIRKGFQDKAKAYYTLKKLFATVKVVAVDEDIINSALDLQWDDFEDCVQFVAARGFHVDYIVTRDIDGFKNSTVATISPADFIKLVINDKALNSDGSA